MGLLDIASANSFWRGYDYFKKSRVLSCKKIDDDKYEGAVQGSGDNIYQVYIDLEHPKKSTCTCPHADGTRRACKHKVALYFSLYPEAAEQAIKEAEEWEAEEERRLEEEREDIKKYVYSLTKQELRDELLWRIIEEKQSRNYW